MGLLLRAVFGRGETVVVECRRCGKTLDRDATTCPVCASSDIAVYEIE